MRTATCKTGWMVQPQELPGYWLPCGPRAAAYWSSEGRPVRLVAAVERALQHARLELSVPPWVIRQGLQKAGGTQARALVCLCLKQDGFSQHQIAKALGLSQSSVADLIKKWADDRDVKEALAHWPTPATAPGSNHTPTPPAACAAE